MSYRPEWFPKEGVLEIVLHVVTFIRGSYSTMPENHTLNVKALRYAVDNWTDYNKGAENKEFDNHVRVMILMALEMESDWQEELTKVIEKLKNTKNPENWTSNDIGK